MSSPYLPDSDHIDYLIEQYQDIIDVCNATMPELVIRDPPFYGDAPITFGAMSSGNPTMYVSISRIRKEILAKPENQLSEALNSDQK